MYSYAQKKRRSDKGIDEVNLDRVVPRLSQLATDKKFRRFFRKLFGKKDDKKKR